MSQVRNGLPSRSSDPLDGAPQVDPAPFPSPSTGQDTNAGPSSVANSAVAPTTPNSPTPARISQNQNTDVKEENPAEVHPASRRSLVNGTAKGKSEDDFAVAAEAVTQKNPLRRKRRNRCTIPFEGQPQSRVTVRTPPASTCVPLLQNGAGRDRGSSNGEAGNGVLCSELKSLTSSQKPHRKLQSHHSINSQISKKSKGSSKSASSQIPTEAQEDCCVHCILSCLFCEFLTLCNIMLDCATCGSCSSEDSCICCCCCGSGECADCDLPCDMDCGIIDACCESADCLEICMECCGLCFSS